MLSEIIQRKTNTIGSQFSSVAQSCLTLCDSMDVACQAYLSFTFSQRLLKFMSIESVILSKHLVLCRPLLLLPLISTPGFPVPRGLLELAQTHVHRVGDHPTISSSFIPFFSCLQSFPTLESFRMSQFFASGGQSIGASALALPMNIQG